MVYIVLDERGVKPYPIVMGATGFEPTFLQNN